MKWLWIRYWKMAKGNWIFCIYTRTTHIHKQCVWDNTFLFTGEREGERKKVGWNEKIILFWYNFEEIRFEKREEIWMGCRHANVAGRHELNGKRKNVKKRAFIGLKNGEETRGTTWEWKLQLMCCVVSDKENHPFNFFSS